MENRGETERGPALEIFDSCERFATAFQKVHRIVHAAVNGTNWYRVKNLRITVPISSSIMDLFDGLPDPSSGITAPLTHKDDTSAEGIVRLSVVLQHALQSFYHLSYKNCFASTCMKMIENTFPFFSSSSWR